MWARAHVQPATRDDDRAAYYFRKELSRLDRLGSQNQDVVDALIFLAEHCRKLRLYDDAEKFCYRLLDFAGKVRDVAERRARSTPRSTPF